MNEKLLYKIFERLVRDTLIFTYPRCVYYKGNRKLYVRNDYNYLLVDVMLELMISEAYALNMDEQTALHEMYEMWIKGVTKELWN